MNNWLLLIIICVLLSSIGVILQKKIINASSSSVAFGLLLQILNATLIGIYALITGNFSLNNLPIVNVMVMTVLYCIGTICYFTALKMIDASEFTILFASRVFFTIIASSTLLHEFLSGRQIAGTILIILAIVVVTIKSKKHLKLKFKKGEILALLTAAAFGTAVANDNIMLESMNVYSFLFLAFLLPALSFMVVFPKEISKVKVFLNLNLFSKMLGASALQSLTALSFFAALQLSTNTPQLMVINLTSVVLTVILAIFLLKEKTDILKKITSAALTLAGLILMNV